MAIQNFEDLEIWKEARSITREIYKLSQSGHLSKDYSLRDQMRRAAVSTMANIAEGFERGGNQEFIQFLYVAKASCGELRSELYVAVDQEYIEEKTANSVSRSLKRLSIMIKHLIDHLRRSTIRGPKYDKSTASNPSKAHQPN